ncbi:hypothetical protein H1C71_039888, partial [Ictidomys tridecemlineatus]
PKKKKIKARSRVGAGTPGEWEGGEAESEQVAFEPLRGPGSGPVQQPCRLRPRTETVPRDRVGGQGLQWDQAVGTAERLRGEGGGGRREPRRGPALSEHGLPPSRLVLKCGPQHNGAGWPLGL